MGRFKVRRAGAADLDELVRQRHMMFADMKRGTPEELEVGDRAYRKWVVKKVKEGHLHGYIVFDVHGEVAAGGAVWLREEQPGVGHGARLIPYLMSMYTEPRYRRKGLASMVVQEAVEWARRNGYPGLTLHASKKGRKVYSKLGWTRGWEMFVDF